jgi:hypothetical protein
MALVEAVTENETDRSESIVPERVVFIGFLNAVKKEIPSHTPNPAVAPACD